jgi:hypothetical protein
MRKQGGLSPPFNPHDIILPMTSDDYWTFQTAKQHGGSFISHLADAGLLADPNNRKALFQAFPQLKHCFGPQTLIHRQLREGVTA